MRSYRTCDMPNAHRLVCIERMIIEAHAVHIRFGFELRHKNLSNLRTINKNEANYRKKYDFQIRKKTTECEINRFLLKPFETGKLEQSRLMSN